MAVANKEMIAAPSLAPTEWKNSPNVTDLKSDLESCRTNHSLQVNKINGWLDNMAGEGKAKPNVKSPTKSKHVPKVIRKHAEWRYASLSEPFLNTPDIFSISPVTWEDKEAAKQNALVLNNQFNTKLRKVKLVDEYVRTAVDEGTVVLKVGWEYEEETQKESQRKFVYVPVPENIEAVQLLAEVRNLKLSNPTAYMTTVPEELKRALEISLENGVPHLPRVAGEEVVETTKVVKNQPSVEICNYKNVYLDPAAKGDVDKARFIVYSFETTLSDLQKDGRYKNLQFINIDANSALGDPDHDPDAPSDFNLNDDPRKKFVAYEYWGFWDITGTGIVKPIVATWVGDTLIRLEDNPFPDKRLPFVVVHYLPVRGSNYGEPDGHLLEDNQKIAGAVTRGMIDIMASIASGQRGVAKNALDPTNRRKWERGADYEFNPNTHPEQAFHVQKFPEIPASAQYMLAMQNQEADALTGVKAFSDGLNGDSLGTVATGVRGALDAASKREVGILRRLAEGMAEVGRKVISMNAVFLEEEEVVRITNEEFVPVRRDDLAGNFDLTLAISTAEEDNAKAQELSFMLQTVGPNISDPRIVFEIMAEIADLRRMPSLAKKLREYQPQPDPVQQEKAQLENELLRAKIASEYGKAQEANQQAGVASAKAQNIQSDTDKKNLDFVEQESGVTQERELQKQGAQAEANAKLEAFKHGLEDRKEQTKRIRDYVASLG